jgi:hypothetical protein
MKNINYFLELNNHWSNVKKWWNSILITSFIIPNYIKKVDRNQKNIFNIKLLLLIKKVFNIDDINKINKISINDYDFNTLINNIYNNTEIIRLFISDIEEIKHEIIYFMQFKDYFPLIYKKIIEIIRPLVHDENFSKLFKCDDDLTRLAPIGALIIYLYLIEKDVEKLIEKFIEIDPLYIQFFIISYLILDGFMDEDIKNIENKNIFLKWFMKIVNNPSEIIILEEKHKNIWQCITFAKYVTLFIEKYPFVTYKIIYDYVIIMIKTLNGSNIIQKNESIDEDSILEQTFKKSYIVYFFMILLTNVNLNYNINKKTFSNLCKLSFLVQLCDDYIDIYKDKLENNYTYFNSNNIVLNFNERLKKLIITSFSFMNNIDDKNKHVKKFSYFLIKNFMIIIVYINNNELNYDLLKYIEEYSLFSIDILKLFKEYYDYLNNNYLLEFIKSKIL